MSNDLIPVADVERMALMLVAQAEGRHPAIAERAE